MSRVGWLVALSVVASLPAQDRGFWAFLESGRVVTRCVEASPEHQRAVASLERLGKRIEGLKNDDPPAKVEDELHALLKSECFLAAAETERVPAPDSSESLKKWWRDGGRHWLGSYLELPRLGSTSELASYIVVPPDARRTLYLDSQRDHPLQSLLCARTDASCGAVTRGWRLRADAHFESHRALRRSEGAILDDRPASGTSVTSRECAEKASSSGVEERYQAWRDCIESQRPKTVALPLGELKAPTAGWLVISGRRGHYDFCDTTRAYNLATGAAFISDSCSGLALRRNGTVDIDATNSARAERTKAGRVPVQNIREAVWMMLFRGEATALQLTAEYYPLPAGFIPQVTVREGQGDQSPGTMMFSTAQTQLTWRWMPPTGAAFVGQLTWPDSFDAAEDHAVSLLSVAEAGLADGCAAERPPSPAVFSSRRARDLNDVSPESIEDLRQDFRKAFDKWKTLAICPPR